MHIVIKTTYFRERFSGISKIPSLYGAIYLSFKNQQENTSAVVNAPLEDRNGKECCLYI